MGYYKKQLKRLARVRKLLNQKRNQLREMREEGITLVTFHTTTRSLTLPYDQDTTEPALTAYHELLSNQRQQLKRDSFWEQQQWADYRELTQRDKQTLLAGKLGTAQAGK